MKFNIVLTWSKLMAFVLLMAVTFLVYITKDTLIFTYSIPFIIVLITGKQLTDVFKKNE